MTLKNTWASGESFTADDANDVADEVNGAVTALDGKVATSRTITAGTGLTGGGDLTADRTLTVSFGTTASTACVGNDSRLSDARTPTAHNHAASQINSGTLDAARIPTIDKAKLASGVQSSLDLADTAVQPATLASAQTVTVNAQTGTTYTLVLGDASKAVECSNSGAITLTVPPNSSVAFATGTVIEVVQTGAGQVTIAPGSGVTLSNANGLKTAKQWSIVTLRKRAADSWIVAGDTKS